MALSPTAGSPSVEDIKARARGPLAAVAPLSPERLSAIATERLGKSIGTITFTKSAMTLSARQPYDAASGQVDVFQPGRWDATSNQILMDFIVTGAQAGEWDGSAAYVQFKPHLSGDHLVAVHFSGFQTTTSINGPWGAAKATTQVVADAGVVLAIWNGAPGSSLFFTVDCKGPTNLPGVAAILSIEVHKL